MKPAESVMIYTLYVDNLFFNIFHMSWSWIHVCSLHGFPHQCFFVQQIVTSQWKLLEMIVSFFLLLLTMSSWQVLSQPFPLCHNTLSSKHKRSTLTLILCDILLYYSKAGECNLSQLVNLEKQFKRGTVFPSMDTDVCLTWTNNWQHWPFVLVSRQQWNSLRSHPLLQYSYFHM